MVLCCCARLLRESPPVIQVSNSRKVAAFLPACWLFLTNETRQPCVHRHRWVPACVYPFFFISPVQMGHLGLFLLTGKAKQKQLTHFPKKPGIERKRPVYSSRRPINRLKTHAELVEVSQLRHTFLYLTLHHCHSAGRSDKTPRSDFAPWPHPGRPWRAR